MEKFFISSPIGFLEISVKENRLYSVSKMNQKALKQLLKQSNSKTMFLKSVDKDLSYIIDPDSQNSQKIIKEQKLSPFARRVKQQLKSYFKGKLKSFDIALYIRGTAFQKKVWNSLQKIPWGKTKTYGQMARQLNMPKGSRAIGNGCAKNPFLIVVPCHRVLSQKGLGGFALGLKAKKQLLSLENLIPLNLTDVQH